MKTLVRLRQKGNDKTQMFSITQANAILKLANTQWELNDDNYILNENGIERKPSKRKNTKSDK